MSENSLAAFGKIKAVVLDVDGVLTEGKVTVFENGEQVRTFNIKDGYAVVTAIKAGIKVIVISAGTYNGVRTRLEYLGVEEINLGVKDKLQLLKDYQEKFQLQKDEMLYMGDDMPDYYAMQTVGLPTCPADASPDIIAVSKYVSPRAGGQGAVRDVLEKILKLQGKWPTQVDA